MKKEGMVFLLAVLLILSASFVIAETNEKGYKCLEDKVEGNCDSLSFDANAFTVLATGKCQSALKDKSKDNECWPSSSCKMRETGIALLALERVGGSTNKIIDWILNQKKVPKDLIWYLEIDPIEESECVITYDETEKEITIGEDKKINKGAGSCLKLAQDNYWLQVDNNCYEKNFTISCDKDFVTTLIYKKQGGSTVYVSSETNPASSEGKTEERVKSFCLGTDNCDYEGTLWATLALASEDEDVSEFLPYLMAMAEDNQKFFPAAFLYTITGYSEYIEEIANEQKNGYWKISGSNYHQFYDTALALMALQGTSAEQLATGKQYLLEVQGEDGCWRNDVRDTAFILYAVWPKGVSGGGGTDIPLCTDNDYFCVSALDCKDDDVIDNLYCSGKVCCKKDVELKSCSDQYGEECDDDEICDEATVPAFDTNKCCKGKCEPKKQETDCEKADFVCRSLCEDGEEVKSPDCGSEKMCCGPETGGGGGGSYWWVWLLIILIVLVVVGIIFRNKLRAFIFKLKGGFKEGPSEVPRRPGFPPAPPGGMQMRARPRMILPRGPMPPRRFPPRPVQSKTDKEFESTLKRLKEMSK